MEKTYCLIGIDRINGTRTRSTRFKPQPGLTKAQLEAIRERELAKLKRKHRHESEEIINDLAICFQYREEKK